MEITLTKLTLENFKGKDLSGQRFGRLTVIRFAGKDNHRNAYWECLCDCGNRTIVQQAHITHGTTVSCGCKHKENNQIRAITHGMSKTRTFRIWAGMIARCKYDHFPGYRNRGISVCRRWHKFENFLADMGKAPVGMSIDRIDSAGNYSPSNCRWATQTIQCQNRRARGYIWDKRRKKWMAQIKREGKHYFLGRFETEDEANEAYWIARRNFDKGVIKYENHA